MKLWDLLALEQAEADALSVQEDGWVDELLLAIELGDKVAIRGITLAAYHVNHIRHPMVLLACIIDAALEGIPEIVTTLLTELDRECRRRGLASLSSHERGLALRQARVRRTRPGRHNKQTPGAFGARRKVAGAVRARTSTSRPAVLPERPRPNRQKARKTPKQRPNKIDPTPETPAPRLESTLESTPDSRLAARVNWLPAEPAPVTPPPIDVRVEPAAIRALVDRFVPSSPERALAGPHDGLDQLQLAAAAIDLRRASFFDHLLALDHVRSIEHFPHQVETVRRVMRDLRGRALLADEVGLGKTIEAGLITKEYILRGLCRSVLILCPPSLVGQWKDEMARKFDLDFATPKATPKGGSDSFFDSGDLLLCSLAIARRTRNAEHAKARRFDLVIVDEAHHVKNRNTLGFQLVDGLKRRFLLLLTATPVQNQLDELYNLVTLLRPGLLGTRGAFGRKFVARGDPRQPKNREALREHLSEVMIRNTRALVDIRLPPRFVKTVAVEPAEQEQRLYQLISTYVRSRARADRADGRGQKRPLLLTLLAEAGSSPAAVFSTLEAGKSKGVPPAMMEETRALQLACADVGQTAKVRKVLELLAEAGDDKTAIFVKYRATLAALEGAVTGHGIPTAVFHGGLSATEKQQAIDSFRDDVPVLLSTEIGGEGRNLQFCRRLVNFDLPWNPFAIEQRIGRLHRIGQQREVYVTNLCARGTLEDYLLVVLDEKLNMFELVIGELDMILGDVEEDLSIASQAFSIWTQAETDDDVRAGFDRLGTELEAGRKRYEESRALDDAIFGRDFEAA